MESAKNGATSVGNDAKSAMKSGASPSFWFRRLRELEKAAVKEWVSENGVSQGQILVPKRLKRLRRGQNCTHVPPDARIDRGSEDFRCAKRRAATNGLPSP
jgi:hypothetical protein